MVVNYVNPIIDSFKNIFPQFGITEIEPKELIVRENKIESLGVVIIIGLIGDIKGNIIYTLNIENAKKIASIMMMGMPIENFDDLAQSAISELVNMLTANVATNFSSDNITVDISTPTLIHGNFTANATCGKIVCLPIKVNDIDIEVNISLEKNTI